MGWFSILKMGVIGTIYVVDGKKYHFSPEDIERYEEILSKTQARNPEQRKRIALRNVIRERNIQPKGW